MGGLKGIRSEWTCSEPDPYAYALWSACEGGSDGFQACGRGDGVDGVQRGWTGQDKGQKGCRLLGGWQHLTDAGLRLASQPSNSSLL